MRNWWRWLRHSLVEKEGELYQSGFWMSALVVFWLIFCIAVVVATPYLEAWQRGIAPGLLGLLGSFIGLLIHKISRGPYRFGQLGQPLVQINQDALTLALADVEPPEVEVWPPQIELALPTLRALTVKTAPKRRWGWLWDGRQTIHICLELTDGTAKTVAMQRYSASIYAALIDFLRRKLPPSVQFTVDT